MNRKHITSGLVTLLLGASGVWLLGRPSAPEPPAAPSPATHDVAAADAPKGPVASPDRAPEARLDLPSLDVEDEDDSEGASTERPRPAGEWQGMKVDESETWPCGESCSMARACVGGMCVPCTQDDQCQTGEVCVLDHCVQEKLVECRRAADCGSPEALCVLTGYTSGDLRGNRDMRAHCSFPDSGRFDGDVSAVDDPRPDDGAVAALPDDLPPKEPSIVDELRRRAGR